LCFHIRVFVFIIRIICSGQLMNKWITKILATSAREGHRRMSPVIYATPPTLRIISNCNLQPSCAVPSRDLGCRPFFIIKFLIENNIPPPKKKIGHGSVAPSVDCPCRLLVILRAISLMSSATAVPPAPLQCRCMVFGCSELSRACVSLQALSGAEFRSANQRRVLP